MSENTEVPINVYTLKTFITKLNARACLYEKALEILTKPEILTFSNVRDIAEDFNLKLKDPSFESISKIDFIKEVLRVGYDDKSTTNWR